jgi:hypothetical protein
MPYVLTITLFDLAGYFSAGLPSLTGSIFAPALVDTTTSTTPSLLTLSFTSAAVPPAGDLAMLVTEVMSGGDFLRSDTIAALPPSPGMATAYTVPPALIPAASVTGAAAGFAIPPTALPGVIRIASGILSLGLAIPLVVALSSVTTTLGTGSITVTATGALAVREFFFFVVTYPFSFTATFELAPSADPTNAGRVLSVTSTTSSVGGIAAAISTALAPLLALFVRATMESSINGLILSTAPSVLATMGRRTTSSAVFSAHKITVAPGGISLQLAVTDLFGPAIVSLPRTLAVSITPTPVVTAVRTYTVTVTDAVTGAPVQGALAILHNYSATGSPEMKSATTNGLGRAVFSHISLHFKALGSRELDPLPPTLAVTAMGFDRVLLGLF